MILNHETRHADSATLGMEDSMSMTIDTSDQAALMSILSENLYKDPVGSLVRESASNALDACREAGNTEPIIVSLKQNTSYQYVYSVQDFGTGISPERVKDVLSKYAASTKRGSNEYLGYYGLGFKAPLAYTDSFVFITRFGGREYTYTMYKSEKGTKIDLVNEREDTTNKNGTTVQVTLKNRTDYPGFVAKIKEQLAYFEGVYFDVPGVNNDFKITKNEDWKHSGLLGTPERGPMHICLENVYYEIDWQKLGISRIDLNVGLNFKIEDGLLPIPSREDIKYTEEAKELIKIKIAAVADYFVSKFNEKRTEVDDFEEIWNKFNMNSVEIEGNHYIIDQITKYSYLKPVKPTLRGIKLIDLEALAKEVRVLFSNYVMRGKIYNFTFTGKYDDTNVKLIGKDHFYTNATMLLAEEAPKGLQLEYLKSLYPYAYIVYKKRNLKLGGYSLLTSWQNTSESYVDLLELRNHPKSEWRARIIELQSIIDKAVNKLPKIADLQPTQEWLDERKTKRNKGVRGIVGKTEMSLKIGRSSMRGDRKLAWDSRTLLIKNVGKTIKSLIIYGTNDEADRMEMMYPIVNGAKSRVTLALINKYDIKKIKDLHNFISINDFMKGENKPFKAYATALLIEVLQRNNNLIFGNIDLINELSEGLATKMMTLKKYREDNYPTGYYNEKDEFLVEVLKIATEHNLFDEGMILIYNEVREKINIFDFVKLLPYNKKSNSKDVLELSREILRGRKFRMDWENYLELNPVVETQELDNDEDDDDENEEDDNPYEEGGIAQVAGFTEDEIELAKEELTDEDFRRDNRESENFLTKTEMAF